MEWPQSGPQSPRWIETDQFRGSWSLSESTARLLAIVVALAHLSGQAFVSLLRRPIRALVFAHVAHMLEVSGNGSRQSRQSRLSRHSRRRRRWRLDPVIPDLLPQAPLNPLPGPRSWRRKIPCEAHRAKAINPDIPVFPDQASRTPAPSRVQQSRSRLLFFRFSQNVVAAALPPRTA